MYLTKCNDIHVTLRLEKKYKQYRNRLFYLINKTKFQRYRLKVFKSFKIFMEHNDTSNID